MPFRKVLKNLSDGFLDAWNSNDTSKLMSYFKDTSIFYSPNVSLVFPDCIENNIKGKEKINEYLSKLYKNSLPILERNNLFKEKEHLLTYCTVRGTDIKMVIDIALDEYGKIKVLKADYVDEFPETSN